MRALSAEGDLRNFSRAGTFSKRPCTVTEVPGGQPFWRRGDHLPPRQVNFSTSGRVAGPRHHGHTGYCRNAGQRLTSKTEGANGVQVRGLWRILLVAWRRKASSTSPVGMPQPLSVTLISSTPLPFASTMI